MQDKVFVLILGYNSLKDLNECITSLLNQDYKNYEICFADNNSNDGSVEYIKENFSTVRTFQFKKNNGYAGGNNILIRKAFKAGADFCLVLNPDTKADKNLITNLVITYEKEIKTNKIGLVQPVVMIYDMPEKINSAGNVIHYLGFGYCGGYMSEEIPKEDKNIISVSGTTMLISKQYYKDVGLFDEDFFMYNEDQDYSWRGFLQGYKHYLSVSTKVWHKYSFVKNQKKMYFSEKNRLIMILKNYSKKTLLKLIPILILNESLILIYSLFDGWFFLKIKSYFLIIYNWKEIRKKRKIIQLSRLINDKDYLQMFTSKLSFSEINNLGIRYLVNPLYYVYQKIIL